MARRRIGQEYLGYEGAAANRGSALDELARPIDWAEIDRLPDGIYAAAEGEPARPPLALLEALLPAAWYDLPDVKLAGARDDRASFRRFCGFAAHEPTPERTAFVRFRREFTARGLDRASFESVVRQLDRRGVVVRTGTPIDATLIAHRGRPFRRRPPPWFPPRRRHPATTPMVLGRGQRPAPPPVICPRLTA